MNLDSFFKEQGYNISAYKKMLPHIEKWGKWWEGYVDDFHRYEVYDGNKSNKVEMYRLSMAKTVAEAYADLLLNEKVKYNIGDEEESKDFYNTFLKDNDWEKNTNQSMESVSALGTGALVNSLKNIEYNEVNDDADFSKSKPFIEFITAEKTILLSWVGSKVIDVAFITEEEEDDKTIVKITIHKLVNGLYEIHNFFFEKDASENLTPIIKEDIAPVFRTGSNKPWFTILKTNIVNNIEKGNPYGISVYANAIDQLKGIDKIYDSFVNEFIMGRKRLFISEEAVKVDPFGNPRFDNKDLIFYTLEGAAYGGDSSGEPKKLITESNMVLRISEHEQGINKALSLLSVKVGLGENYFKFESGVVKTATEVISTQSKLYSSIRKQQIAIENSLYDFFSALIEVGNEYFGKSYKGEISIDFDDSIVTDEAEIKRQAMLERNANLISPVQYFMETRKMTYTQAQEFYNNQVKDMSLGEEQEEEGGEM